MLHVPPVQPQGTARIRPRTRGPYKFVGSLCVLET